MSTTRRSWFPPRLADVAARAGTSKATASRALGRGHPNPSPTLRRVQEAAQDLGYRPPTDRAHLLALSTDISRTGYWATVSGVVAASEELGADLSIHVLSGGSQRRREILSRALDGRVDGVVLLEFDSVSVAALEDLPVDLPVAIAGAARAPGTRSRLGPGQTTMPGP
ncbi:LacI family DNA-binding transcriptional regulator [Actinomyces sp. oral taxon 897]|uniref:LacI family DNA-binding transcriptional regulator n=1 Tax=Actinomyces sp. oral taxon 897 TaxID=2081702 RepID=UPI001C2BDAD1|nr:LacI family DNA-binding transcriptional regulator [Actinomyces sp. oral taxon 897]